MKRRMLLIYNPVAGTKSFAGSLSDLLERFTAAGFEVTVYPTAETGDASWITRERAGDFDYLVCSGGDGTLGEVVAGLMELDRRPRLGYIPSGSTNDFAYTHELETDIYLGARTVLEGEPTALDIGRFNDGYFTYVAAFGLFTDISYGTPQGMKNLFGHAAYLLEGVKKLRSIRHWNCTVELDGEVITDDFILGLVLNAKSVGGFRLPSEVDAKLGDGKFEVILLRKVQRFSALQEVVQVLMGSAPPSTAFIVRSASRIRVVSEVPLDWSVDGEFGGSHTEVDIKVHPGAIEILTPPKKLLLPCVD